MRDNAELIASLVMLAIFGLIALGFSSWSCSAKWADSGFQSRFQVPGGCQIKMKDGRWIPADKWREVDQ